MKLRPEEITTILRQRIEQFEIETDLSETGAVLQVADGIARVHGLESCVALEMLEFESGSSDLPSTSRRTTSAWRSSASGRSS